MHCFVQWIYINFPWPIYYFLFFYSYRRNSLCFLFLADIQFLHYARKAVSCFEVSDLHCAVSCVNYRSNLANDKISLGPRETSPDQGRNIKHRKVQSKIAAVKDIKKEKNRIIFMRTDGNRGLENEVKHLGKRKALGNWSCWVLVIHRLLKWYEKQEVIT